MMKSSMMRSATRFAIVGGLAVSAALLSLSVTGPAYAAPGGEGNNTNCNGKGNPNSPCQGNNGGVATVADTIMAAGIRAAGRSTTTRTSRTSRASGKVNSRARLRPAATAMAVRASASVKAAGAAASAA